jgi:RNA polymerase sigma-70 factor (ECF subfamily)
MHDWQEVRRQHGRVVFGAVFRILKRHDQALDCYQEVFLEAFQQCSHRPVRNWAALLRWLAVRRALDRLRKERRATVRVATAEDAALLPDVRVDPSAEIEFRELVDRVRLEVARLPERQAEAFWLHCVEELSYEEVAEQLGTDTKTVAVLVHRARAGLRQMLADLNPARIAKSS